MDLAYVGDGVVYHDTCFEKLELTDAERETYTEVDAEEFGANDDEYSPPSSCDGCLAYIVADTRAPEIPPAQEIFNLQAEYVSYREAEITMLASQFYHRMLDHGVATEWQIDALLTYVKDLRDMERFTAGPLTTKYLFLVDVIAILEEWRRTYPNREIIEVRATERGYVDAEGGEYILYDMRGCYLDMFNDGRSACSGCGVRLTSCALEVAHSSEAYCGGCFTIA